jgi:ATP-dependent protease Clp ATPase subunit
LPKIEKSDSEKIMAELKRDMEESWTPSKLVAALDKHIISQDKAKRVIA